VRRLGRLTSLLAAAARLAESRQAAAVVFLVALSAWWLEALVIPLQPGRDFGTYVGAYVQLIQSHAVDLGYVLGRTPLAPLLTGGLLDVAGGALAEPVVSLLYAASVAAWFLAARVFGGAAALLTALVLLTYPGYWLLFHELSSDALFAAAFAGWSLLVVRVLQSPTPWRLGFVGAGVGVLALIRPGSQVLLLLAPLLAIAVPASLRTRAMSAAAFVLSAVVIIGAWTVHNGLRYGDYTFVRGGNSGVPFYRAFVVDRIVRPDNGSASRELARAVERELLPLEPYRSYGIDRREFFTEATPRMYVDLIALSNRMWGWKSDARKLRDAGIEAVREHPVTYARGVVTTTWQLLRHPLYTQLHSTTGEDDGESADEESATIMVEGRRLPRPTEGDLIPAAHEGGVGTPDNSIRTVWTSPTEHYLVFDHPEDHRRYESLHRRMDELGRNLPDRRGHPTVADRLNQASRWYPPPIIWLGLGLAALALRRRAGWPIYTILPAAALLIVGLTALAVPAAPQYSVPVAPAFVLLAAAGLFAGRREQAPVADRARLPSRWFGGSARRLAGIAVAVLAAAWAAKIYYSNVDARFAAGEPPHDLDVFIRAASKVVDGASPYAFQGDQTYAYPPLVAFLVAPLDALSAGAATIAWTLLSLAAIAASLWLLGVRDWRCYALTAVFPFTRSAVGVGTIGPLLLLALAAAWRWRDQVSQAAAGAGAAVALKLFLWPVLVWFALLGRVRTALVGLAVALVLALLPWAAIDFDGLAGYPGLLRRLADEEATSSYSVVALMVRAHLPESIGVVVSILLTVALLAAAAWVARDAQRSMRDREVAALSLALAAALAASPIVWIHYFLLLLAPLALTRPRLSWLWFLPLAYYPLGETAWPTGDARKLALAWVTTAVLVAATTRRRAGDSARAAAIPSSSSRVPLQARLTRAR
jgi:hypothetical protein